MDDPTATGKANFGFMSKYKNGATVPTGQTDFVFKTVGLNFHRSEYEWLVVTGNDSQIQGYRYNKWCRCLQIHGSGTRGNPDDTFRIKIWEEDGAGNETVKYDNLDDQPLILYQARSIWSIFLRMFYRR